MAWVPWSDAKYREAIRIKILVNKGEGNAEEIMEVLGRAIAMEEDKDPPLFLFRNVYPAGFVIYCFGNVIGVDGYVFNNNDWDKKPFLYYRSLLRKMRGAGIKGQLYVNHNELPFQFNVAGQGFDEGHFIGSLE